MTKKLQTYIGNSLNVYENLAAEKLLLDSVEKDSVILYLWQNENTIVIGKNQNAWAECKTDAIKEDSVNLSRRLSGGGAVFHDIGNLNFTFIAPAENYDLAKQMLVIKKACAMAGIKTELSGRNDILANGRKFSGNAFYNSKGNSYHHGTLLISADMNKMGKYLTPSKSKLQAKGVKSVESRVVNLSELCPDLTVDKMRENMILAAEEVYGLKAQQMSQIECEEKEKLTKLYSSWDYIYGTSIPADFACEGRFSWGGIQLKFIVKNGTIEQVQVFSDSMDFEISEKLQNALNGQKFEKQIIAEILFEKLEKEVAEDILSIIANAIF